MPTGCCQDARVAENDPCKTKSQDDARMINRMMDRILGVLLSLKIFVFDAKNAKHPVLQDATPKLQDESSCKRPIILCSVTSLQNGYLDRDRAG